MERHSGQTTNLKEELLLLLLLLVYKAIRHDEFIHSLTVPFLFLQPPVEPANMYIVLLLDSSSMHACITDL